MGELGLCELRFYKGLSYAKHQMQVSHCGWHLRMWKNWCVQSWHSFHDVSPRDIEEISNFEEEFRNTLEPNSVMRYVNVLPQVYAPILGYCGLSRLVRFAIKAPRVDKVQGEVQSGMKLSDGGLARDLTEYQSFGQKVVLTILEKHYDKLS